MANLALLLEPFPIRNSFAAHAWIGQRLCAALLAEPTDGFAMGDMRVVCNGPMLGHIAGALPAARPYLVQPPQAAQAGFAAMMADWHTVALPQWTRIQHGSPAHEPLYEALLLAVRAIYPFDVLAYWGTNETLRSVADRLGIPMLWAELGPLRPPFPPYYCLDPNGVNGMASGRNALRLRPAQHPAAIPGMALELPVGDVSAYEATMLLPPASPAFTELLRFVKGRRRVVLLAMQLADDANILTFGNGWTCQAMVDAVLAELSGPGTVFVLRPHPAEAKCYHTMAAGDAVRAQVAHRDDVLVCDTAGPDGYLACLSVATEVVCINSSVGFEAALLGKPVRVLGEASYRPPNSPAHPPAGAARGLDAPLQLEDDSIGALLRDHYIPEARFWTAGCWREAAAALPTPPRQPGRMPRLPTAETRVLGPARLTADGLLVVDGIGALVLLPQGLAGTVDRVAVSPPANGTRGLRVAGWGQDPQTGGLLAGFVITTGAESIWCATLQPRQDVAAHFSDPAKLATGFACCIAQDDMGSAWQQPIRVYGVTVTGHCGCLNQAWWFDPAAGQFAQGPDPGCGSPGSLASAFVH